MQLLIHPMCRQMRTNDLHHQTRASWAEGQHADVIFPFCDSVSLSALLLTCIFLFSVSTALGFQQAISTNSCKKNVWLRRIVDVDCVGDGWMKENWKNRKRDGGEQDKRWSKPNRGMEEKREREVERRRSKGGNWSWSRSRKGQEMTCSHRHTQADYFMLP